MLYTRYTELLGLDYAVMSAPMSGHSGSRLAASVSLAGGLGTFGGTNELGPEWLRQQISHVRSQTDRPFGVGFISQLIEYDTTNIEIALEERVPVFIFSFADPEPWLSRAKDTGAVTMCQVQSLELARQAVDAGADVLLAQGNEAGGHTGEINLLPLLVDLVERYPGVPVLAAGGITNGRALAGVLAAGAEGASLGTAMLATQEAVEVPDNLRRESYSPTVRTPLSLASTTCWAPALGRKASPAASTATAWSASGTVATPRSWPTAKNSPPTSPLPALKLIPTHPPYTWARAQATSTPFAPRRTSYERSAKGPRPYWGRYLGGSG